jgi:hypothetical protein
MSFFAIFAFAKVMRSLLNADIQEQGRRSLLKERTHALVMDSAKERAGNNILLQKLGPDGEIKIEYTVSKIWMQSGPADYIFVDLPRAGWISDVNIAEG